MPHITVSFNKQKTWRDDFNRMIWESKEGKIDRIFVKSVSHFARNAKDMQAKANATELMCIRAVFDACLFVTVPIGGAGFGFTFILAICRKKLVLLSTGHSVNQPLYYVFLLF